MIRIPLPWNDAALLLTPRWGELGTLSQVALLVALCLVPVALILWLYRYELRLVSGVTATGLLCLRLTVLALVLFLVGFQPIVGRTLTEELPGRVLVAVDRSNSLDIKDPQRKPVEKLRLAKALKLAGDLCPDSQLEQWIKDYDEKGQPQWGNEEQQRRKIHDDVIARVDGLTRTDVAQRVLSPDGLDLLGTITSKRPHKIEMMGFAQEAWSAQPDQLAELFAPLKDKKDEKDEKEKEPRDSGLRTDLRLPLERALKQNGEGQGRILGLVLLTDGQHNVNEPGLRERVAPAKKAIELGEQQLPIFPIALGAKEAPPDIALVAVRSQPTVFKDVDTNVEARFKISGLPEQEVVVELQRDGQPPLEKRIKHDGKDGYHTVTFQVRMDKVGTRTFNVTAKPVEKETRTDNNGRGVVINVADEKARVLLVDGEARWEFHYLHTALLRDRAMQTTSVVFSQPRIGKVPEDELKQIGNPQTTMPEGPDALAGYDCIILGDVSPDQLSLAERQRLEKYVGDRGGTLVILAGKRFMPMGFPQDDKTTAELDPLRKLLPIEDPKVVSPDDGFAFTLTEEGKQTTFLQMDPQAELSLSRWAEMPKHYWGLVGKCKPNAVPLAFFADDKVPPGKKGDREKESALVVRQNYGFGRVLYVGLDSTWRWRYKIGDLYHHRFWSQAIRWAASDKPLIAGNEHIRFGTPDPVYRNTQPIDIVVRLAEDVPPLAPDALAGARILRKGEKEGQEEAVALVPLTRREAQPRVLQGQVRDLPAGQYQIELAIPELADKLNAPPGPDGKPAKLRAGFTVSGPEGEEMIELATNFPLLEELAAKSGGKVFTPENVSELSQLLKEKSVPRTEHLESRMWQWWVTLVLVIGLLTVEWVARKMAGLP